MAFHSVESLLKASERLPLWEAVLEDDLRDRGAERAESLRRMTALWVAMGSAVAGYDPKRRSASGLTGGAGALLSGSGEGLCGPFIRQIIATALKTGECNACMGRIVAAPTAGASGVLPAVLLPYQEKFHVPDGEMVHALYAASGFGQVIATRASISGAEGGCQAEIGSASAMAAAALVHLHGGTPAQMANACAMALKNLMGLVCDPVAGLVEVPCVKRNVVGAMNAMACAEMALAGVKSAIPCDEVIDAMRSVGEALPSSLRETGQGGLAATPTGRSLAAEFGDKQSVQ
jgi:L-serine dehydratase